MNRYKIGLFTLVLLLLSCSGGVRPIRYGKDECAFCRMTIMENKFGAELVNRNGKVFTFDSGECLARFHKLHPEENGKGARLFVADYASPGNLVEVDEAYFVHGPSIYSPMGGNLVAYASKNEAERAAASNNAKVLQWEEVKKLTWSH